MEKIYFLAPDPDSAKRIVSDFKQAGIPEKHIHAVANSQAKLEDLPEASAFETTDFLPALERGAALGGTTGLLAGVVAVASPPAGIALGGGALLATTLTGASFGAWASSMLGASVKNSHIREFEDALDKGEVLILAEVDAGREDDLVKIVHEHHPEASVGGKKSVVPPAV